VAGPLHVRGGLLKREGEKDSDRRIDRKDKVQKLEKGELYRGRNERNRRLRPTKTIRRPSVTGLQETKKQRGK